MVRQRCRGGVRPAYTLLELVLALAVLSVLAGVSVPYALRMHAEARIAEAADAVRAQLAGARARAIEGGLVFQFRYEPDGRHYFVAPFEHEIDAADASAVGTGASTGVGQFTRFAGSLPPKFHFVACCLPATATGAAAAQQVGSQVFNGLPNANELTGLSWSPPILFGPDGGSADSAFEVVDRAHQSVRLEVRGLTGAVGVGRVQRETRR